MKTLDSKIVLLLFQVLCINISSSENNSNEGDVCTTNGDLCKRLKDCSYFNHDDVKRKVFQPPVCGFNGSEPIVCCTKHFNKMFGFGRKSKATEMCEKYDYHICNHNRSSKAYTPVHSTSYPFLALIGYGPNNNISWKCAGSVISNRYILSAAQCSDNKEIGPARWVRIGDFEDASKMQNFNIILRISHPNSENKTLYDDIALYKVNKEIKFNDYVRPACVHSYISILTHRTVFVLGRGRYETDYSQSMDIAEVELNLLPLNECNVSDYRDKISTGPSRRGMICAGHIEADEYDCPGDHGGPVFLPPTKGQIEDGCFLYTQVALTTIPYQCSEEKHPGVYTNVGNYIHWIETIVWSDDSSSDGSLNVWV